MAEPAVRAFVIVAWVLAAIVVILTRITVPDGGDTRWSGSNADTDGADRSESTRQPSGDAMDMESAGVRTGTQDAEELPSVEALSTDLLLANAVLTHGSILLALIIAVVLSGVSLPLLGVDPSVVDTIGIGSGVLAGLVLYVVDETLSLGMKHVGFSPAEFLRSALAPTSLRGWIVLLLGILPLVSVAEELLFRGALIGATIALGFSPILVILFSSVLFGFAHGIQGGGGVAVAAVLGLGLGLVFLWTESLLVVGIAHYVVNALEFLVHEGIDSKA